MFSILSAIATKAGVVWCIYEIMIKLMSPQRAQANSKLENPFGSIGVQDIKNVLFSPTTLRPIGPQSKI